MIMGEAKRRRALPLAARRTLTVRAYRDDVLSGAYVTEHWLCVDCGRNTAPGIPPAAVLRQLLEHVPYVETSVTSDSEIYEVRSDIWEAVGMAANGGCLCIVCLEARLGRALGPDDFDDAHCFEAPRCAATARRCCSRGGLAQA
jgi:hypothetical protein